MGTGRRRAYLWRGAPTTLVRPLGPAPHWSPLVAAGVTRNPTPRHPDNRREPVAAVEAPLLGRRSLRPQRRRGRARRTPRPPAGAFERAGACRDARGGRQLPRTRLGADCRGRGRV